MAEEEEKVITIKAGDGTSVWVDAQTFRRLTLLSESQEMSKAALIRMWAKNELEKLDRLNTLSQE